MKGFDGNQRYAFISYSHKDSDVVKDILHKWQEEYGINVWWDAYLLGGKNWFDEDVREVLEGDNCRCVFFFASDDALTSDNCLNELNLAAYQGLRLIPVNFKNGRLSGRIEEIKKDKSIKDKVGTAEAIITYHFPDKKTNISLGDEEFDAKSIRAYNHFLGKDIDKDPSRWIDVRSPYMPELIKTIKQDLEDPDGCEDSLYAVNIKEFMDYLAMFVCEAINFRKKGYYSHLLRPKDRYLDIVYYKGSKPEHLTAYDLLMRYNILFDDYVNEHAYFKNYEEDGEDGFVTPYEAVYYLAKVLQNTKYIKNELSFIDGDNLSFEEIDSAIERNAINFVNNHPEVAEYECVCEDIFLGIPEDVDFRFDEEYLKAFVNLRQDHLYAFLKAFWNIFVDKKSE